MRDPLVPPGQRTLAGFLHHRHLVVVPGEAAHRVQAGEERDRGEHHLLVIRPAQQPGAAKPADQMQVLADFGLVVTLVVIGGGRRCPASPYPRDHSTSLPTLACGVESITLPGEPSRGRPDHRRVRSGKSSVAAEIAYVLEHQERRFTLLDLDYL